jgi:hypothetical protein
MAPTGTRNPDREATSATRPSTETITGALLISARGRSDLAAGIGFGLSDGRALAVHAAASQANSGRHVSDTKMTGIGVASHVGAMDQWPSQDRAPRGTVVSALGRLVELTSSTWDPWGHAIDGGDDGSDGVLEGAAGEGSPVRAGFAPLDGPHHPPNASAREVILACLTIPAFSKVRGKLQWCRHDGSRDVNPNWDNKAGYQYAAW